MNCNHFQWAMLAYNLNCWLMLFNREEAQGEELKHTTLATSRLRFLFLAAKIWRHAGRVRVSYSDHYAAKGIFQRLMQRLEERVAKFILKNLRQNSEFAWCRRMLDRFRLPPTVHHHAHYRVWQRRSTTSTSGLTGKSGRSWTTCTTIQVERRLVEKPGDWPWSSCRFYYLQDSSVLAMDRMP